MQTVGVLHENESILEHEILESDQHQIIAYDLQWKLLFLQAHPISSDLSAQVGIPSQILDGSVTLQNEDILDLSLI